MIYEVGQVVDKFKIIRKEFFLMLLMMEQQ